MNKELQVIFESFDINGDGILTHDELIMGYEKMLGCSKRASF